MLKNFDYNVKILYICKSISRTIILNSRKSYGSTKI